MVHISAPGKLFLSGEWAILDVGNTGTVAAVNRRVHAQIDESKEIRVVLDDFNITKSADYKDGKILWRGTSKEEAEKLVFIKGAIETALRYLGASKPFRIRTWGEETQVGGKKIGFGSSAAAVTATIAGILAFNKKEIASRKAKDVIYKLSAVAHYYAQGKLGSAFDVAASTYGGVFAYKRFDPVWVVNQIDAGKSIAEIVNAEWPGLYVEELPIPNEVQLIVGWTGEPASTTDLIKRVSTHKERKAIFTKISGVAGQFSIAWKKKDWEKLKGIVKRNEEYLYELGQKTGVEIETKELRILSEKAFEAGGAGKLSGAGGGDCGIGFAFSPGVAAKIRKLWEENGIKVLDVTIDKEGIRYES